MPLGTKLGVGPGDTVLDGDPTSPKGAQPPIVGPSIVAKLGDQRNGVYYGRMSLSFLTPNHYSQSTEGNTKH